MATQTKVVITGDTSGAVTAVSRLSKELGGLQSLAAKALNLGGLGVVSGFAGLVALTKKAADAGDALSKLSQKTGTSVEDLSKLQYAAGLSGVSTEALAKGMTSLAVGMIEARDGGITPAAEAFSKLGVSVKNVDGTIKSSRAVLGELADRFAAMPDGPEKAALAVDLFGKKLGSEMIPLLNSGSKGIKEMGAEAERLGVVMSTELAKKSEEFNDNLERMSKLSNAAGISIAKSLVPALNDLLEQFVKIDESGASTMGWLFVSGNDIKNAAGRIGELESKLGTLRKMRDDLSTPTLANKINDVAFGDVGDLNSQIVQLEQEQKYLSSFVKKTKDEAADLAAKRILIEREYQDKYIKLLYLRGVAEGKISADILDSDEKRTAAQIKNAEKLKAALTKTWQDSLKEAQAAGEAAQKLFTQAADVRQTAADKVAEKRRSTLTPEDQQTQIRSEFDNVSRAAEKAANLAKLAAFNGRTENAAKLAKQAARDAERAVALADRIDDPNAGANAIEKAAKIQADLLEQQGKAEQLKQQEAQVRAAKQANDIFDLDQKLTDLQTKASSLKINADISAAEEQLAALQTKLDNIKDKTVTVTVNTTTLAGVDGASQAAAGFARGGYTGPGSKWQPAGVVHAGEFVVRQEIVRQPGALQILARLNQLGLSALKGYAGGGLVDNIRIPSISNMEPPTKQNGTPITLVLDGHHIPVSATQDVAAELTRLFSRAALKRGGRK